MLKLSDGLKTSPPAETVDLILNDTYGEDEESLSELLASSSFTTLSSSSLPFDNCQSGMTSLLFNLIGVIGGLLGNFDLCDNPRDLLNRLEKKGYKAIS